MKANEREEVAQCDWITTGYRQEALLAAQRARVTQGQLPPTQRITFVL